METWMDAAAGTTVDMVDGMMRSVGSPPIASASSVPSWPSAWCRCRSSAWPPWWPASLLSPEQ